MPDILPPVKTIKMTSGPPSDMALRRWGDVITRMHRTDDKVFRNSLLLQNIIITYQFAKSRGIMLPPFNPELETRFLDAQTEFFRLKDAVRRVIDREWGARWTGNDFDIVDPAGQLGAVFIPVLIGIGVVALVGVISRLIYLESENDDLSEKYNSVLEATDNVLCSDPHSEDCKLWEQEKLESGYRQNKTFADTIKGAAKSVGAGLGKGLMFAIPLVALAFFWGKK